MKKHFLSAVFFFLIFVFSCGELFGRGKTEETESAPVNTEWVLCITAPDVSGLPLSRQITGDMVSKNIARVLSGLNFRQRGEEESAYYEDYAWTKSRAEAAKALSAKRSERDLLVYRGDKKWKYRKNLKTVDEAIVLLEKELAKIDAAPPVVEEKPVFKLPDVNKNGTFPAPPAEGDEYRFCTGQKADAFLVSSLSEYHGRIYLNIKMYTLYTRSFSYEDSVLFSSDDIIGALDEVSGRLSAAISAFPQAGIIVQASPEESIVIIDELFAGKGEVRLYTPGTVEVQVRADNYVPVSVPVELREGEFAELFINLTPIGLNAFELNVPGKIGSRVFLGSRYAGDTPLSLELPRQEFTYISVETPEGEIGSAIIRDEDLVKGGARFEWTDNRGKADFITKLPVSAEEKRVDRARRGFYIAYGAFWFILPASLLTAGFARPYIEYRWDRPYWITFAAHATWGTALGVTLFQIIRYLYVSHRDAEPIVKAVKKEPETEAMPAEEANK